MLRSSCLYLAIGWPGPTVLLCFISGQWLEFKIPYFKGPNKHGHASFPLNRASGVHLTPFCPRKAVSLHTCRVAEVCCDSIVRSCDQVIHPLCTPLSCAAEQHSVAPSNLLSLERQNTVFQIYSRKESHFSQWDPGDPLIPTYCINSSLCSLSCSLSS